MIGTPSEKNGFSLLETIVALGLVAMLLALVPPAVLSSLPGAKFATLMDEIAARAKRAKSAAVYSGREAGLDIDLNARRIAGYGASVSAEPIVIPADVEIALRGLARNVGANGRARLRFFPDGTNSGLRLILTRAGNEQRLSVEWLTGIIHVDR